MNEIVKLAGEIKLIKNSLLIIERNSLKIGDWMPKKAVMRYFDYADNQIRLLERNKAIVVSKVGRRKFYSVDSIIELINKNKLK